MQATERPRVRWAMRHGLGPAALIGLLAGCQAYTPAPLELETYRGEVASRLTSFEPVSRFMGRLDGDVPDRFDPSDGLTHAEGEALALFYNPRLRLARLGAGAALASYETAGLWEDPEFGFDGAEILSGSEPFEFGLTLALTIPVSGRLGVEKDRAGAAYEAERLRVVDAEWETRAALRRAWAAWSVSEARLALLRGVVEQTERIATITDELESAGELSRVEARLIRADVLERRADVAEEALSVERARLAVLGLMGVASDADVALIPGLAPWGVAVDENDSDRLIRANTALAVRRAEHRVAEESLRLEVREQYPDITIGGGYGSEDDDDRLLLGASFPLPVFNANRRGIAEAGAQREITRAVAETTFDRLTLELSHARNELRAVRDQRATFEAEIVPVLDEQAREIERLIELGEVDTLLLLDSVTRRYSAGSRLLGLRLREREAEIEIARLLGPDAPLAPAPIDSDEPDTTTPAATAGDDR